MSNYKLVPMEPTEEMVEAAKDAYMPFGDMDMAIRMALLEAPDVQGEPLGYVVPRMAARLGKGELCGISVLDQPEDGHTLPVYLTPQPALQEECKELRTALAESRANDRQAMYYLNQVREIVGGNDFPDMVERCRELVK